MRAKRPIVLIAALVAAVEPGFAGGSTPPRASRPASAMQGGAVVPSVGEPLERLFGLAIERIVIEAPPSERKADLLALTGLTIGRPCVAAELRRAVKLLYQLDRFENVYVSAARVENGVYLEFVLPPRPRVRDIRITGNDLFSASEIEDAIGLRAGSELDLRSLGEKRERLASALRRVGYRKPAIGIAAERVDLNGSHDVILRIDEGPRTRLRRVVVRGTPRRPLWALGAQVGIHPGDVLDLTAVDAAFERLEREYRQKGYVEVRIQKPEVRELDGRIGGEPSADLLVDIDAGPLVSVRFEGHREVSLRELEAAASIMTDTEIGAGSEAIAEVKERILSRYERRGYWQTEVDSNVRTSIEGDRREIVFSIREGNSSYVASIRFVRSGTETVSRAAREETSERRSDERGRRIQRKQVDAPLGDDRLREKIYAVVAETLSEEIGSPGADPETVGELLGDHSLSLPRDSHQPDTTSPDPRTVYVKRAYDSAASAIADLYLAEGYQTVKVERPRIDVRPNAKLLDVTFEIREGVKWEVGALSFTGNESVTSGQLLEISKIDPSKAGGEPLSFYRLYEASRAILAHYRNEGYLYARIAENLREVPKRSQNGGEGSAAYVGTSTAAPRDVAGLCREAELAGEPSCPVELAFRIVEGPLVRTRNVVLRGVESTSESLVRSEIAVEQGEILRESDMLATRANLLRVGVFERVNVRPIDEKSVAAEKDVVCEVRERKHSSFEVGAGASTEEGVRIFAGYGHNNLFGTALRFQTNAKVNFQPFLILYDDSTRPKIEQFYDGFSAAQRIEREIAVGVSYPRIFGLPRGFGAGLDISHVRDNAPAFAQDTFTFTLTGNYTGLKPVVAEKPRPVTLQLRSNFDLSILLCNPQIGDREALCSSTSRRVKGTSIYTTFGPSVRWDLLDDPVDPRSGAFVELATDLAKGLDASSPDFVNVQGKLNLYLSLTRGMGFAFSLFAGRIFLLEDGTVPVNRKYFAGGRSTVRGYPEQSLFPQDDPRPQAEREISSGGLFVAALKNELRFPISGLLSGAVFYDIGDLYEVPSAFAISDKTRQGAGAGIRYATPVGPLSLDFAVPLVRRGDPGEVDWTIHFSVRSF